MPVALRRLACVTLLVPFGAWADGSDQVRAATLSQALSSRDDDGTVTEVGIDGCSMRVVVTNALTCPVPDEATGSETVIDLNSVVSIRYYERGKRPV